MVLGERLLLAELRVEQFYAGVFEKLSVVERLEFGCEGVGAVERGGRAGARVDIVAGSVYKRTRVGEKLKVKKLVLIFPFISWGQPPNGSFSPL